MSDAKEAEKIEEKIEGPAKVEESATVEEPVQIEEPVKPEEHFKVEEPVKPEEPVKAETPAAAAVQEPSVQDVVDKAQDSKAENAGVVETAEDEGKGKD